MLHVSFTSSSSLHSLLEYGERILRTGDPTTKVALTLECHAKWNDPNTKMPIWTGECWHSDPPDQPARSAKPVLFAPKDMPSMKDQATTIPISILHALSHIELGAIDNYWDTIVRFDPVKHQLPRTFYHDFLQVASDEARHFAWCDARLRELGSYYGDLPAHKALLEHASNTASDLAARIAVVPLVQEARGLDSGHRLVHKLKSMGDKASAEIVAQIVLEERQHVACGIKWFRHLCAHLHVDPVAYFHELVLQYFPDGLPGPFDMEARLAANMDAAWYEPLETKTKRYESIKTTTKSSIGSRLDAFARHQKKVILAGSVWPERTSSAAGVRSSDLITIFQQHGYQVLCVAPSRPKDEHSIQDVEFVQCDANSDQFQKVLAATDPQLIVFDRFIAEEMYGWQAKKYAPRAMRILDLQDVHFLRKARESIMKTHRKDPIVPWSALLSPDIDVNMVEKHVIRELASIFRSDLTLYVSEVEREMLVNRFQVPSSLLHRCDFFYDHVDMKSLQSFEQKQHIAFIGSFKHAPNVDAVEWLFEAIYPAFAATSHAEIHIYGSYATPKWQQKIQSRHRGIKLMGFAENVHDTLAQYRLTVAPLRFGAGIKGKIADSWYVGTPCVTTPIGAEAMTLDGRRFGGAIATDPVAFATAMAQLYNDQKQWQAAQATGLEVCQTKYDRQRNASDLMEMVEATLANPKQRENNWIGRMLWSEKYRATEYMSRYIQAKNVVR